MRRAPLLLQGLARRHHRRAEQCQLLGAGWRGAAASADGGAPPTHHHVRVGEEAREKDPFIGGYTPVTKALWRSRLNWDSASAAPSSSSPRAVVVTLPFSRDAELRDTYANPWSRARMGRLLEDLDSLSGTAAFAHVAAALGSSSDPSTPSTPPPQLVTASVDAIHLARPLRLDRDLRMCGRVVWTGSSSLDVRMEVTQGSEEGGKPSSPSLVALFSYVALDRATRKPVRVPALAPSTDDERRWFEERQLVADARRRQRQREKEGAAGVAAQQQQQQQQQASDEQQQRQQQQKAALLMRRLSAAAARLADLPALSPPRLLPVSLTRVDNALVTQPQHRNTAGRVFGGFLMRRAFELSFAAAFLFAGCRPAFMRCDDVSFSAPVDVGDLMRFSARVLAAWKAPPEEVEASLEDDDDGAAAVSPPAPPAFLVAVEAVAERARPDRREVSTTNTFRYVFRVRPTSALRVPIPTTAEDAQRVAAVLAELSEEDLEAVEAALDSAESGGGG
jgi:acyl-coenzyme A thioesterase 9